MQLTQQKPALHVTVALLLAAFVPGQEAGEDLRENSSDPWVQGLPDGPDLSARAPSPKFPGVDTSATGSASGGGAGTEGSGTSSGGSSSGGSTSGGGTAGGSTGSAGGSSTGRDDVPQPAVTDAEPNNTFGTAQTCAPSAMISGTIDPENDYDRYAFEVARRGSLYLTVHAAPADVHPVLRIYDGNNSILTGWLDVGVGKTEVVDLKEAGRYSIAVADKKGGRASSQSYRIGMRYYAGDQFEPNESFGARTLVSPNARLMGTILPRGDYDLYAFEVERRGAVEVRFPNAPKELDLSFRFHDRNNGIMTGWIKPQVVDGGTETTTVHLPTAGNYHVVVADGKGDARSTDAYSLYLTERPGDAHEPNDDVGTATIVPATGSFQAGILPKGDYDYFGFDVERQGTTTVTVSGVPDGLDVSFRLHNPDNGIMTGWIKPGIRNGATEPEVLHLPGAGRYYLVMAAGTSGQFSFDEYRVELKHDAGDAHEPNPNVAHARTMGIGNVMSANLLPKGDYDFFSFDLATARSVHVSFPRVPDGLAPTFRIRNAENGIVTGWNTPRLRDGAGEAVEIALKQPGRYYLVVANDDSNGYSPQDYQVVVR